MEKVYRLLPWLDIGQAVDWLQDLTTTDLTERDLLALCASRQCSVYTSADGIAGYDYASEVVGQGIQRVCNPLALIRAGTETTAELTFEGPVFLDDEDLDTGENGFWAVWRASTPLRGRRALFRPGDIQALADAMNGAGMDEGRTELEDLRQQLEQERTARQAAEQRAEQAEMSVEDEKADAEHWWNLCEKERQCREAAQAEADHWRQQLEYAREATELAEAEAKPSHLLAIAALLELLLDGSRPRYTQGSAADAIEARHPDWRGSSASQLTKLFAMAKTAAKEADKAARAKAEARQAAASRAEARESIKT